MKTKPRRLWVEARARAPARSEAQARAAACSCSQAAPRALARLVRRRRPIGNNVFFFTTQGLVAQDRDELVDVYDARVGGGIAAQE